MHKDRPTASGDGSKPPGKAHSPALIQHYQAQAAEVPVTKAPQHIHFAAVVEGTATKEPAPMEQKTFHECNEEEYHDCKQQHWSAKQQRLHRQYPGLGQ